MEKYEVGEGKLTRHDHSGRSDTESDDKSSNRHLSEGEGSSLEDSTNDEQRASHVDCALPAEPIRRQPRRNSTNERAS